MEIRLADRKAAMCKGTVSERMEMSLCIVDKKIQNHEQNM